MTGQETGREKDIILKKTRILGNYKNGVTKNLRGQGAITYGAGEYGDCNCSVRSSLWGIIQIKILANWKLNMGTNQCWRHSH